MPFEFPKLASLHLPTISLPSLSGLAARFSAFKGRVASALQSLGRRDPGPVPPLQTRHVASAPGPLQAPIKALRAAVAVRDLDQELAEVDAELKEIADRKRYLNRLAPLKPKVSPDEIKETSGLDSASLDIAKTTQRDAKALASAPLKEPEVKPTQPQEPHLAPIGHVIARWNHKDLLIDLSQKLSLNFTRLDKLAHRDTPLAKFEIAEIQKQNTALAQKLGTELGKAFQGTDARTQTEFALGSGGALKEELWALLRHGSPALPDWHHGGDTTDFIDAANDNLKDRTLAKNFLDQVYKAAAAQLPNRLTGNPDKPTLIFNGTAYEQVKLLGRGGAGAAYLYESKTGDKLVLKAELSGFGEAEDFALNHAVSALRDEYKTQIAVMGENGEGHPNVLNVKGIVRTDRGIPIAVLDYAPRGNLRDLIGGARTDRTLGNDGTHADDGLLAVATKQGLVSPQAANLVKLLLLRDSVEGMAYLQEAQGTYHADFKPENLFIGAEGEVKVADFGLSKLELTTHQTVAEGTRDYMPPEMHLNADSGGGILTAKADTWAIGVMAHELFVKQAPFNVSGVTESAKSETSKQKAIDYARSPDRPTITKLSDAQDKNAAVQGVTSLDRLINAMLHADPEKRPALSAIPESSVFDDLGRGPNDRSAAVRELIQALTTNPQDPALIKAKSDALGI